MTEYCFVVTYPPTTTPPGWPVLNGCGFRFRENAEAYAAKEKGRKVKRVRLDTSGFSLSDFAGEQHPPARPASGGKLVRRILRGAMTAARELHRRRRHGAPVSTGGLGMRPPGCGVVNYQDPRGKHLPRMYAGEPLVDPETASIVSGSVDETPPDVFELDADDAEVGA